MDYFFNNITILIMASMAIGALSIVTVRQVVSVDSFYKGYSSAGQQPGLWMLTLSQVTTWIFARSLMNAAILGFYYGFWGVLAYACYYISFLTGGIIVDRLRFRHQCDNVQTFLKQRFGHIGTICYNFVIGLRLVSEVFANLLVIALFFGAAGSGNYTLAVIAFSLFTLAYSFIGGLHSSLRTDRIQMIFFAVLLTVLLFIVILQPHLQMIQAISQSFVVENVTSHPGLILIAVALLQVFSYPLHDPVMMDRGFLTDRKTTRRSFHYAFVISFICIMAFGSFGLLAAAHASDGLSMTQVLEQIMGSGLFLLFQLCLIISAISTLDSTLSSSAKLVVADMQLFGQQPSITKGRLVMVAFMLSGVALVFLGSQDLFDAVAISGTASMFLLPVIFFQILGKDRQIHVGSYLVSFAAAIAGSVLYFLETSKGTNLLEKYMVYFATDHKYMKLLLICIAIIIISHLAFILGVRKNTK